MTAVDKLNAILENEIGRIRKSYPQKDTIIPLIEIIKSLDYQTFMLAHNVRPGDLNLLEKYKLGWAIPFYCFYKNLELDTIPVCSSQKKIESWTNSVIQHGSYIQLCKQLLSFKEAGLMELQSNGEKSFTFTYLVNHSYEVYEQRSLAFYHNLMNKILEEKTKSLLEKRDCKINCVIKLK